MTFSLRAALIAPLMAPLLALSVGSLALVPAASQAATQGSGHAVTETRSLPEFQAIGLAGSMDLVVRQGAQQSVQIQADDNLLPLLETVVERGSSGPALQVRWKRGQSVYTKTRVLVTVVLPKLSALAASGAGDIKLETFNTPALQVSLSGSGDARLDSLTTGDLGIRISGSGDVSGSGTAGAVKVSIDGSGDVRLAGLKADDVSVKIAGSGNAAVNAQKTLDASIAGSGDVSYTGNPAVKSSVAGSGSVTRK